MLESCAKKKRQISAWETQGSGETREGRTLRLVYRSTQAPHLPVCLLIPSVPPPSTSLLPTVPTPRPLQSISPFFPFPTTFTFYMGRCATSAFSLIFLYPSSSCRKHSETARGHSDHPLSTGYCEGKNGFTFPPLEVSVRRSR